MKKFRLVVDFVFCYNEFIRMGRKEFMTYSTIYNAEEEKKFAAIAYNKEVYAARKNGENEIQAAETARTGKDKARRAYALDFLNRLEKKLSELSNQETADILRALIASGLPVETEEELEYWIEKLEHESLHRIALYFLSRENAVKNLQVNHRKKFLINVDDFTAGDITAFASMMSSVNRLIARRMPKDKGSPEYKRFLERKKFFKRVEKILKKDAKEKKQKEQRRQRSQNPQQRNRPPDYLDMLKAKMLREGVIPGKKYWESVIDDFNQAENKGEFVSVWQKDEARQMALDFPDEAFQEQIQKLRGIEHLEEKSRDEAPKDNQKSNDAEANQNAAAQQAAQAQAQANAGR